MALLGVFPGPHTVYRSLRFAARALQFGSPLSAYQYLLKVVEFYPWRLDLLEASGQYAIQGGDFQNGVEILQRVAQSKQLSPDSQLSLGDAALVQEDPARAIQIWHTALHAGGDPGQIYPRLVQANRNLMNLDAAIENLEKLTTLRPGDADVVYQLGLLYVAKNPEIAVHYLEEAIQVDPNLRSQIQPLRRRLRTALLADNEAYALLAAGRELASLEQWDLATYAFSQAVLAQPDYAEAWAFLGEAKQHVSFSKESETVPSQDLQKALSLDPDSIAANTLMAIYYQRQDRYDLALVYLHASAAQDPDNPALQIEIGNTLAQIGEIDSAKKYYQQAVDMAPNDPDYWRALANFSVNYELEVREIGLPAARRAIILDPSNPSSLDVMGRVFTILDDPLSAQRFLDRALRLDPGYAPARLHLGILYLSEGNSADALKHISLAQSLSAPGTPISQQAGRLLDRYIP
jgi:tetratricopeptide (TPR) repeat protein